MKIMASLLRLLLLAAFVAGVAVPAAAASPAQMQAEQSHSMHHAMTPATSLPYDEACREHCLAVSLLVPAFAEVPRVLHLTPAHLARGVTDAPSVWPQPEGHPPRI